MSKIDKGTISVDIHQTFYLEPHLFPPGWNDMSDDDQEEWAQEWIEDNRHEEDPYNEDITVNL
ncbi:MAG: hypothetical protein HQL68_04545 [Magnetococcales bacterium]|nr:hypothetical protein [Magnetococcales bacterium]